MGKASCPQVHSRSTKWKRWVVAGSAALGRRHGARLFADRSHLGPLRTASFERARLTAYCWRMGWRVLTASMARRSAALSSLSSFSRALSVLGFTLIVFVYPTYATFETHIARVAKATGKAIETPSGRG